MTGAQIVRVRATYLAQIRSIEEEYWTLDRQERERRRADFQAAIGYYEGAIKALKGKRYTI